MSYNRNKAVTVSEVEDFFAYLIKQAMKVSCYVQTTPLNLTEEEFAVIDCDEFEHYIAYSEGIVYVRLYAKPQPNGCKNVRALQTMENTLDASLNPEAELFQRLYEDYNTHIDKVNSEYGLQVPKFIIEKVGIDTDLDTRIKWHFNILRYRVLAYMEDR